MRDDDLSGKSPRVDSELSAQDFQSLAALVHRETGIFMPESKHALLQSRLFKRLRVLGLSSFRAYRSLLESGSNPDEMRHLISAVTTNVTRFNREGHHFDELRAHVLPDLIARARRGEKVRLWSAGCSTGEEPYSLAMTVLNVVPDAARLNLRILATDLDAQVLDHAVEGVYPMAALEPVPESDRRQYFEPDQGLGRVRVAPALRELIAFRQLNLLQDWPVRGPFDVIMCRNVVIYFDDATQRRLWQKFARVQAPGGRLLIGHSERLSPDAGVQYRAEGSAGYVRTTQPAQPGDVAQNARAS